jgi:hypothetical protein
VSFLFWILNIKGKIMKINETQHKSPYSNEQLKKGHLNHMDGISYDIQNPIHQLRIVASSCFFGEPMYYHEDDNTNKLIRKIEEKVDNQEEKYLDSVLGKGIDIPNYRHYSSTRLMETAIDEALDFDAEATLKEAVRLRNEDNIRTTPQVIMVRAANHSKVRGTGLIGKYYSQIMKRTDEASVQLAYQVQVFGKPIPNALKKAWKHFLEKKSEYSLAKYRMEARRFKTVDVVNLVKAHSQEIDLLMKGQLKLSVEDTWEALISQEGSSQKTWEKAIPLMSHMALLRNIRNFHKNDVNPDLYLPKLINTAKDGQQLPFRYYSAYKEVKGLVSGKVLDAIEECLEISLGQMPQFEGKVMSLCDNSGSAQGTTTSSMGTVKISDIANLTALITGRISENGYVGVFGDDLKVESVRKKESIFTQMEKINQIGEKIGQRTENGIWLFFDNAIKNKEYWDHIFVYSDMQAGHGGLYGINEQDYNDYRWQKGNHIDVAKLIKTYREKVNPNVQVYLVQVAGYKDVLVPEFYEKTYILGGWGDSLLRFAHKVAQKNEAEKTKEIQEKQATPVPVVIKKKSRLKK